MGGWREEWETEGYRVALSSDEIDFLRVRMQIERGRLVRFTAQYEIVEEDRTYGVVRYDSAHGEPHRDFLDWNGRVISKTPLTGKTYDQALKEGTADIKVNWPTYRERFERLRS